MGKQLVNFITCDCESSAPFLYFTKPSVNPRRIGDSLYELLGNPPGPLRTITCHLNSLNTKKTTIYMYDVGNPDPGLG